MPDARPTRQMNLSVIGTTGLRESGGFVFEERNAKLRGINGVRLYQEMLDNNAILGTVQFILDMIVRQAEWKVMTPEGMEDNPAAIKEKDFIEGALGDMSHTWEDFISEVISMLYFGWSYFETVYKVRRGDTGNSKTQSKFDDGRWGWRKIEIRAQDTLWQWLFDEENGLDGMLQQDIYRPTGGSVVLPIEKCILFRTRSRKGNPEGYPLLRPGVRSWHFLKRLQEIEAIGIERDLTGMPVMEVPRELLLTDASPEDVALRSQLETMIQKVHVNERWGGLLPAELDSEGKPTGFKFRLVTTGGRRMIDTNSIINRYESRIAMLFLSEFIMVAINKVGAQSADKSKKDMLKVALNTVLTDMIASPFNRFGIGRLMSMNRVPQELWPRVVPARLDSPELDMLGKFIESMSTAGLLSPNRGLENRLLQDAKLPTPPDEDMEIFDDKDNPTPRDSADQAAGVLSPEQIAQVLEINRSIAKRELTLEAAKALAAAALGMDPGSVERFLIEEPPEPPPVQPGGIVTPPGSVPKVDDVKPDPGSGA